MIHIYDAYALFQRIKDLSHADTMLYFEIPNGDSWQGIEKEGHKYQFGLTLLEPGAWPKELGAFNIYYRSLGHYRIYFHHIGYSHLYLKVDKKALETSRERVIKKFDELEMIINDGPFEGGFHNEHAKNKFNLLKQKINDVLIDDPVKFHLIYDQHFWQGYAAQEIIPDLEKNNDLVSISLESSRSKQTFRMNALLEKIARKLSRYKLI